MNNFPLCVDLDGTLIKSDSLLETLVLVLKTQPYLLLLCFFWIWRGKAFLKAKLASYAQLNHENLPYSAQFLAYLKEQYQQGRQLILITAADGRIARSVAAHLGIFTEVIASDAGLNMRGVQKRAILNDRFGPKGYDYAGNAKVDLEVWQDARQAILVNASARLAAKAKQMTEVHSIFHDRATHPFTLLKAIRVHQFLKNVLVFVPIMVGHLYFDTHALINSILAFFAFCCCVSGVYLLNDLLDLNADRQHPTKRHRPFASGDLSLLWGFLAPPLFFGASILIALFLPLNFLITLIVYAALTFSYSFYLKRQLLLDVFTLAMLYTLRIVAGMTAINSGYSEWLISFSIFFFLSLAFAKRYCELYFAKQKQRINIAGRAYTIADLPQVRTFGIASGYISVLIFSLYISSEKVATLYQHPTLLWSVCLILLFWITRLWMLTARGEVHEDPVVFAIKDKMSLFITLLTLVIMVFAAY